MMADADNALWRCRGWGWSLVRYGCVVGIISFGGKEAFWCAALKYSDICR